MNKHQKLDLEEQEYLFNERAAIKEYDGNMPRRRAEKQARRECGIYSKMDSQVSPCVKKCRLVKGICAVCERTKEEIINWTKLSHEEKKKIMKRVEK